MKQTVNFSGKENVMMCSKTPVLLGVCLALMLALAIPQTASAAGTASGTTVSNTASVDYSVGGINQTDITSEATTFVVDKKIDVLVTQIDASTVNVTPGQTTAVLEFTVKNEGNSTQDFLLTAPADGDNDFTPTSVAIYLDDPVNGTQGEYDAEDDVATSIEDLAADATKTVFIVATGIPADAASGETALYHLQAQVADSSGVAITTDDSGSADDPDTVQIVFADGDGTYDADKDGKHSDDNSFIVVAPVLSISKTSAVISDPVNNTTNPKRIPGAVIEYTITVSNAAGAATATDLVITDAMPTNTTYLDGYLYLGVTNLTEEDDTDAGDFNVTAANSITVTHTSLAAEDSIVIKYRVTVD